MAIRLTLLSNELADGIVNRLFIVDELGENFKRFVIGIFDRILRFFVIFMIKENNFEEILKRGVIISG